jgi:hypothetical protein
VVESQTRLGPQATPRLPSPLPSALAAAPRPDPPAAVTTRQGPVRGLGMPPRSMPGPAIGLGARAPPPPRRRTTSNAPRRLTGWMALRRPGVTGAPVLSRRTDRGRTTGCSSASEVPSHARSSRHPTSPTSPIHGNEGTEDRTQPRTPFVAASIIKVDDEGGRARFSGGAIRIDSRDARLALSVQDSRFENNKGSTGGAISVRARGVGLPGGRLEIFRFVSLAPGRENGPLRGHDATERATTPAPRRRIPRQPRGVRIPI